MFDFIIINRLGKIPSDPHWTTFDIENQNPLTVDYRGKCYRVVKKQKQKFAYWERLVRFLKALWMIIFSLGQDRSSKQVNALLYQVDKIRYFGIETDRPCKDRMDLTARDFSIVLPAVLSSMIFSYLKAEELGKCFRVNKTCKVLANNDDFWTRLIPKKVLGQKQWETYFGPIGKVPPLPKNIHKLLKEPCPYHKKRNKIIEETHDLFLVPECINGRSLTIKTLSEFAKNRLLYIEDTFISQDWFTQPAQAKWMLILKNDFSISPDSLNGNYEIAHAVDMIAYFFLKSRTSKLYMCIVESLVQGESKTTFLLRGISKAGLFWHLSTRESDPRRIMPQRKFH